MLIVACVLRSGGEYGPEHVLRLRGQVATALSRPHRFVCLADCAVEGVETRALLHDWPRWWAKLELFRPGLFDGPVLYLDLDTSLFGRIDDMALGHRFTVLRNVWVNPPNPRIGSAVMAWDGDLSALYAAFAADPERHMAECVTKEKFGDQGFIQTHAPIAMQRWQDLFPGRVVGFRRDCANGIPAGASIICFGGPVRPWSLPH